MLPATIRNPIPTVSLVPMRLAIWAESVAKSMMAIEMGNSRIAAPSAV